MNGTAGFFSGTTGMVLIALGAVLSAGCRAKEAETPADAMRVTSSSPAFATAAKSLESPCNNPAEFGRCGCYMDGIQTSCDLVARCLELGFCRPESAEPAVKRVTSHSEVFTATAQSFMQPCNNPAEFGRCGCFLDGVRVPCDIVKRCLELNFCVAVASD